MSLIDATILTTIATVVLAVGAIVTGLFAYFGLHAQAAEGRRQAVTVSGWMYEEGTTWQARVRNGSPLPVYDLRVRFHRMEKAEHAPVAGPAWRSADSVLAPRESTVCVFPPDTDRDIPLPEKYAKGFASATDRTCVVSITFTDAAGRYWRRDEHGKLQQIRQSQSNEPPGTATCALSSAESFRTS